MNLYLISRRDLGGYDEYQSAVVCAKSVEDARNIHPGAGRWGNGRFNEQGNRELWAKELTVCVWVPPPKVIVRCIGKARKVGRGVVCASFCAG